jgi:conjugative transfer signal peptidase TraF
MQTFRRLLCLTVLLLCPSAPIRINLSPSMPRGLYRLEAGAQPKAGDFVAACLPEPLSCFGAARGYLARGGPCGCSAAPVIKKAAAKGGGTVLVSDTEVTVDGRALAGSHRMSRDTKGRPVPRIPSGLYTLPPDFVWLYGESHPNSWDSRYYGAVPASGVLGKLQPLVLGFKAFVLLALGAGVWLLCLLR